MDINQRKKQGRQRLLTFSSWERLKETLFVSLSLVVLCLILFFFLSLLWHMAFIGVGRLSHAFFFHYASHYASHAGIYAAWVGSLTLLLIVFCVAIPIGVVTALYLEEFAPKNTLLLIFEINMANLAAVPSVVYGLLGLSLFVYHLHLGRTLLSAGLTLSLLVFPPIVVTAREAIAQVPNSLREAAYALGATRWEVVKHHVIPCALPNIMTSLVLALSRALGETAPLVAIGAAAFLRFLPDSPFQSAFPFINFHWLQSDFMSLPLQIFNWTMRPDKGFDVNAAAAALVLLMMTLFLNMVAMFFRVFLRKRLKK